MDVPLRGRGRGDAPEVCGDVEPFAVTVLGLASEVELAWWITLGAGAVVALVVWGLLEWLRRTVNRIDEAVFALWTMGKRVAQNTQTAHMLGNTVVLGKELRREVERHGALARETRGVGE